MASLSNINGIFDVHSTGAILFSTSHGTLGQILKSNGNSAPTWVDPNTVGTGPWLPLAGGVVSGATTFQSSLTVGGALTGLTSSFVSTVSGTTVVSSEGAYSSSASVKLYEAKRAGGAVAGDWSYDDATTDMSLGTSTAHSFSLKTANTPRLTINNSGNATFAGEIRTTNRLAIKETYFGYSSGYKVIQVGESAATKAISLGYNPSGNTSGSFSGNEILIPNNIRLIAPAASNSGYYGLMMLNSSNKMLLGSSNYLIENNYIMALDPATKNVGIGTASPMSGTNNLGLQIAKGAESSLFMGNPQGGQGAVFQTSDNRHRAIIGANVYDDPSGSWNVFTSGKGIAGISVLADTGDWGTGINFWCGDTDSIISRMNISSNGNVNIGVTYAGSSAVTGPFVVSHTSSRFLTSSYESSIVSLSAKNNNNNLESLKLAGDSIYFFNGTNTTGSQSMVILNSGNVGIGTTSPQAKLDIGDGDFKQLKIIGANRLCVFRFQNAQSNFNNPDIVLFSNTTATSSYPQVSVHIKMHGRGLSANYSQFTEALATVELSTALIGLRSSIINHTTLGSAVSAGTFSISGTSLRFTPNRQTNYDTFSIEVNINSISVTYNT